MAASNSHIPDEPPPSYAQWDQGFPQTMKAYDCDEGKNPNTFYLCGRSNEDRLYAVAIHHDQIGYIKGELLEFPGIVLHDGAEKKDPIMAAAYDERPDFRRVIYGAKSEIILWPRQLASPRGTVMNGGILSNSELMFDFNICSEGSPGAEFGKTHYNRFSWSRAEAGDQCFKNGGFKLVQHLPENMTFHDGQTVARLIYSNPNESKSSGEMFTFQFTDQAAAVDIGAAWTLAAVITALRVYHLSTTLGSLMDVQLPETIAILPEDRARIAAMCEDRR
ncbi:hypothetical protein F5Y10DRAFT_272842 [Nemania abortiva]|nr:hypothetical protein F5Y10DRAFT_272842 [Nemania abortiva]